jgi:hypothetical protein
MAERIDVEDPIGVSGKGLKFSQSPSVVCARSVDEVAKAIKEFGARIQGNRNCHRIGVDIEANDAQSVTPFLFVIGIR